MTQFLDLNDLADAQARVLLNPEYCSDADFAESVGMGIVDATESYPGNGIPVSFLTESGLRLLAEARRIAENLDPVAIMLLRLATGRDMNFFCPPNPMLRPPAGKLVLALWERILNGEKKELQ